MTQRMARIRYTFSITILLASLAVLTGWPTKTTLVAAGQTSVGEDHINDFTEYTYLSSTTPLGGFADFPVERTFDRTIKTIKVTIVSGDADDLGFVSDLPVTPNPSPGGCGPTGSVVAPVDVTSRVSVNGRTARFQLRAQEDCFGFFITGWYGARFHWEVELEAGVKLAAVSDPPKYVHIGPRPFPIGPSPAFPEEVLHFFSADVSYENSAASPSTPTTVEYFLSRDGTSKEVRLGSAQLPSLPAQNTGKVTTVLQVVARTPAGRYFLLACTASTCVPSSNPSVVVDFAGALDQAGIAPVTDFNDISWSLLPKLGLTLKQAAELGGYDHFNWYQEIVFDSFRFTPGRESQVYTGVDPMLGGNTDQRDSCRSSSIDGADFFPWYYNEVLLGCAYADQFYLTSKNNLQARQLGFNDHPEGQALRTLVFDTYLAGVQTSPSAGAILTNVPGVHVHWQYIQFKDTGVIFPTVGQNVLGGGPISGNSQFLSFINPEDFTPDRVRHLKLAGVLPADTTLSVNPQSGSQGETVNLTLTGDGTHFDAGLSSVAVSGPGIIVNQFVVNSQTTATANITIAEGSPLFARDVSVGTGDEVAVAKAAFNVESVITIQILVKSGETTPPMNPRSHGKIPVVLLAAPMVRSDQIDRESLRFGRTGTELRASACSAVDVNLDGLLDLVCHFDNEPGAFQVGDTLAIVTGTLGNVPLKGQTQIRTVPR